MGVSLQFVIGNKEEIIDAERDENYEFAIDLQSKGLAADFSLHIALDDLDYLVDVVSELRNIDSFGLIDNLDSDEFFFTSEDGGCGAYYVLPNIKDLFASLDYSNTQQIAADWYKRLSIEYDQKIEINSDVINAIEQMITICKKANEYPKQDLVFIWAL